MLEQVMEGPDVLENVVVVNKLLKGGDEGPRGYVVGCLVPAA